MALLGALLFCGVAVVTFAKPEQEDSKGPGASAMWTGLATRDRRGHDGRGVTREVPGCSGP